MLGSAHELISEAAALPPAISSEWPQGFVTGLSDRFEYQPLVIGGRGLLSVVPSHADLAEACVEYARRERRYGLTSEQVKPASTAST